MDGLISFSSRRDLLIALWHGWEPELFPETYFTCADRLAVDATGFSQEFPRIAQAHGVSWQPERPVRHASAESLPELVVSDDWVYHDPLHWTGAGDRSASDTRYDPHDSAIEYLSLIHI